MKLHVLNCSLCERSMTISATPGRKLMAGCLPCDSVFPIEEIIENVKSIALGNPLKKDDEVTKKLNEILKRKGTR